jgi:sugar/nucleoside kinase (ribokinase family)
MVADLLAVPVRGYPEPGKLVVVDRMELHNGGCAGSTSIALTRLGAEAACIGKVGSDALGDFLIRRLREEGVNADHMVRDPVNQTSASAVLVSPDGERSFIHCRGANVALRLDEIDMGLVERSSIVHIGGYLILEALDGEPSAELFRRAKAKGVLTSIDTVWNDREDWVTPLAPVLPHLDILMASREEAVRITGLTELDAIAAYFRDKGVGTVVLKLGPDGCYVHDGRTAYRIAGHKVEAVDTCGAGDAFAGGYLYGLVQGWDTERCARFANAVGALSVTALGASTGLRNVDGTLRFMETADG